MHTVRDSVTQERNRLEAAFEALEKSIENYVNKLEVQAKEALEVPQEAQPQPITAEVPNGANNTEVLGQIQEIVKNHERKIVELKEEIGRLSVDLVRLKEENRSLKEQNKQASELIGESIIAIEKLVAA